MTEGELLLTIDTSSISAGIAVSRGEMLLAEISLALQTPQTDRLLLKTVAQLLATFGLRAEDFAAFAAVVGPGSFTGLRVGVATVKGLAMAAGRPVLAVSSLRTLAMQAGLSPFPVCALLDARKKQIYAALFDCTNGIPELLGEEMVITPEELLELLPKQVLFVGNGALPYRPVLEKVSGARFLSWPSQTARIGHAAALALADLHQGKGMLPALLLPRYIRRSEAELLHDRSFIAG